MSFYNKECGFVMSDTVSEVFFYSIEYSRGTIIVHSNCRHESIFTGNPLSVWLIDYRKRS